MKHTPGPWIIADEEELQDAERGQDVFGIWDEDQDIRIASVETCDCDGDQIKANALLIAAAPEMFEALIECEELWGKILKKPDLNRGHPVHAVRAALAKARGE